MVSERRFDPQDRTPAMFRMPDLARAFLRRATRPNRCAPSPFARNRSLLQVEALESRHTPALSLTANLSFPTVAVGQPDGVYGTASTTDPMASLGVNFAWGDGFSTSSGTAFNPQPTSWMLGASHAYAAAGTYTVTVTATAMYDAAPTDQATQTYTVTVTGVPPPPPPPPELPVVTAETLFGAASEEGPVAATFRVSRTGDLSAGLDVTVLFGGTATAADYEPVSTTVHIDPGYAYKDVDVIPVDDDEEEPAETVSLCPQSVLGVYNIPPNPIAFATIADNDAPLPLVADFDLDVNANGTLTDPVDRAVNYLPGYEGDVPKVSTGASFNTAAYTGQTMKVILDGIGTRSKAVTRVVFYMSPGQVTRHPGYSSNTSDPRIEGAGKDKDYSFAAAADLDSVEIRRTDLRMERTKTWAYFYAKDYGGGAVVRADVYVVNLALGERLERSLLLKVPEDVDGDSLADKWEFRMADRWENQYGPIPLVTPAQKLALFTWDQDGELADPDGPGIGTEGLVAQKDEGDAHIVLEEYRGYILDGGGFDGAGANGFPGGHIRLDPARKEVLLEVDRAAVLNNVPGTGLREVLDGAAKVFSNADRGAGIYVYYLFDQTDMAITGLDINTVANQENVLISNRNVSLKSDFLHILFSTWEISSCIFPRLR